MKKIENFLKAFTENAAFNIGTKKTNNMSDVIEEIQYLRSQMNLNKPIEDLDKMNIGIYYGHYFYRAMEISDYQDRYNYDTNDEPEEQLYSYVRPSGKRIEVLLFYQKDEISLLPKQLRIYPITGYTEDDLIEKYQFAYNYVFDSQKQKNFSLLDEYINYHMKRQWLFVKDYPEMDEIQDNPKSGFLHPNCFIYSQLNRTISQSDFKDNKLFERAIDKRKRFKEVCENFEFKYTLNIPKYDGIVDEVPNFKKFLERLDNEKQLVVKVEKDDE